MSRIVRAVVMVGGLWGAAAATADTAQDKLTEAKLQADLGRYAEAAAAFEALAGDPGTPRPLRAEALVRLGAVRQAAGERRSAVAVFERVMKEHADDEATARLFVLAVGGALPGDERWSQVWRELQLGIDQGDPARPVPWILWPDATWQGYDLLDDGKGKVVHFVKTARVLPYSGLPVTLDFQDGDLGDVFRLFADITGLNVVVDPGCTGTVTFKGRDVPWDDTLDRMLQAVGLEYELNENVLRIRAAGKITRRPPPRYAGRPIDVWFQGTELAEAFRTIAEQGAVRVDVGPGISGHVHLKLVAVHWDQAFDLLASVNGLAWSREGKVLSVQLPKSGAEP